jgi:hypothetical protein
MVFRTRVIVRLGTQNRMVTKGYRKGVYDRVTLARVGATVLAHAHLDPDAWSGRFEPSSARARGSIRKHRVINKVRG